MIGQDIFKRLYVAGILSKNMNEYDKKQAIRKAGPWKLMALRGLGEDKCHTLLKWAGWDITKEELHKTYKRLHERKKLEYVHAEKKQHKEPKTTKNIDIANIITNIRSNEGRKEIRKKSKTFEQKLYNVYAEKITCAFKDNKYRDKMGNYRINAKRTKEREKYIFKGFNDDFSDNIILVECPPDVLAIEFEKHTTKPIKDEKLIEYMKKHFKSEIDNKGNLIFLSTKEQRKQWIKQIYENAKKQKIDGCVAGHGGTSDYFYSFNLQDLPEGNEKEAKKTLAGIIVPQYAQNFIDWGNFGRTLIPIINRPHWKPKYKGIIHQILYGKNPLEHKSYVFALIDGKVKEKKLFEYSQLTEEMKRRVPLRSMLIKYGFDLSRNPTMCQLGHGSKGKACFSYDEGKGLWYCFHCDKGGSIFNLVIEYEHVDFKEAKKIIEKEFGIDLNKIEIKVNKIKLSAELKRAMESIKKAEK